VAKTVSKRPQPESPPVSERRRAGLVQRDERGNASLSWRDAPADEQRKALEILGGPLASKLSEHIKKMRELEARKRAEKDGQDED
jgi:hypothetical protein